ncbi:response regulator [Rhizobium leguminosarum]|uniref:response regulator n=1 Tax=Rhizobium leguminosarum TaxID=384 RepID=UPI001FE14ED6|nr:response regulator [Rhizobium leguminosarum]
MISVLCIDDEQEVRQLVVEDFSEAGFVAYEASNGRESLELMISNWPDIMICDITMPEMNGSELLADIQLNYPSLAGTPFIFLTALTDKGTMLEALRSGADDYLTKPINFES